MLNEINPDEVVLTVCLFIFLFIFLFISLIIIISLFLLISIRMLDKINFYSLFFYFFFLIFFSNRESSIEVEVPESFWGHTVPKKFV